MNHLIIDSFDLIFRSHYYHSNLKTSRGVPSGCVYGFLVNINAIKAKFSNCHITLAWDAELTGRKNLDTLSEQISDLKNIFSCLNVSQAEYPGEGTNDVIASLVRKYQENSNQIYIYTLNKNLFQLVKDGKVYVIRPKSGNRSEKIYDEEAVKKEFGVYPENLYCFFCFRGDIINNIPGIPGIKSACIINLIEKYRTLSNIYAHLNNENLTDFQKKLLKASEQRVCFNENLFKLREDIPLTIKKGIINKKILISYFDKYEIQSINVDSYIDNLKDKSSFDMRTAPAIQHHLLKEG